MSNAAGGPAFARPYGGHPDPASGDPEMQSQEGMTLRDYFAIRALAALIESARSGTSFGTSHTDSNLNFALCAYSMADAMLEARK
jgi:hypothetical protein